MSHQLQILAAVGIVAWSLNSAAVAQPPASGAPDAASALQDRPTLNEPPLRQRSFLRASSLIGVPIQGTGDVRLGVVGDILIDSAT
ncbi:MAG: hypothetical protein JNG89_10245, partial [Planctomycetaceae bacterium]|nr:hypothetical protein [Planctomycetaceae bacterium]